MFENLNLLWQCCLIHNLYEVSVKKNLRPEDLLSMYDNVTVGGAAVIALLGWYFDGFGWKWYGRCKYGTGMNSDHGHWCEALPPHW